MMHFSPNAWLIAAAIILLIAAIALPIDRARRLAIPFRARLSYWLRIVLAVLLLLVGIRPSFGEVKTISYTPGVDIVFMIDRTTSMAAEDYDGLYPRLNGVKSDVKNIVAAAEGARFAVVVFDNNARVALPFTTDSNAVISLVDAIGWREVAYGTGTDISIGVSEAEDLLAQSFAKNPDVGRYLVYIGDGEQTQELSPASFEPLRRYIKGGLVLGYGTDTGGAMPIRPGSDQYVLDENKMPALSKIDEGNLLKISEQLGIGYQHRVTPGPITVPVRGEILIETVHTQPGGFEIYWVLAVIATGLLAVYSWLLIAKYRRARQEQL